jgi:hypothetical protein
MPAWLHLQSKTWPLPMKWVAYAFSIACGLLAIQIAVSGWALIKGAPPAQAHDYVTYVQLVITFITAVLLAVFNFATTRSNAQFTARLNREATQYSAQLSREAAETLARLQKDLNVETAQAVEKLRAEFTTSVNETTEKMRAELNRSSEDFKARLGQTIPQRYNGYHLMFKAATKYFFAIRRLEEGIYPGEDLKAASQAADDAVGSALIVDKGDRDHFFAFITESHYIAETARETADAKAKIELWEKEGKKYGQRYNALEETFSAKVRM